MVPEFDKHLKKAGRHIGRNVMEITIKMKTIVRKPLMIKKHQSRSEIESNLHSTVKEGLYHCKHFMAYKDENERQMTD